MTEGREDRRTIGNDTGIKMNILLLTTHLNIGGIGIYTISLAKSLKKRGSNVVVASSGGELVEELTKNGIQHICLPINTSADIGIHTFFAFHKLLNVIKEHKIGLVHAQTRVSQVIAYFLSRKANIAFVSTCHGFFRRNPVRNIFPCWGHKAIAISDAVRGHLVNDMKVPKDAVRLIYNGIDISKFSVKYSDEDKALMRKEFKLKEAPTIGMISRLSEAKGHKYLIGAFSKVLPKVNKAQLLIVGDGPKDYLNTLKSCANNLGIAENVIFSKACRDTTLPLSVIDLFCLPTLQEGLGLAILEAMAMGIPVVASDVGGVYTLIKDKQNGILTAPKDEDAIARAIINILSDKAMAMSMGELSRNIVKESFSLDMMTDKVLEVYHEAINTVSI